MSLSSSFDLLVESLSQKFSPKENRRGSLYDENDLTDPNAMKVVLIGDQNVGKSILFSIWTKSELPKEQSSTIGIEFASRTITIHGHQINCQVWDKGIEYRSESITHFIKAGTVHSKATSRA